MEEHPSIESEFQIPTKQEVLLDQERILFINKITGWFRFFLGVITAVVVTLIIMQTTVREQSVRSCKSDKEVWASISGFLHDAAAARRNEGDIKTAVQYETREAKINKKVSFNCEKEIPSYLPFVQ